MYTLVNPRVNWLYESEPSEGTKGRRVHAPRGKTLGGSSSSRSEEEPAGAVGPEEQAKAEAEGQDDANDSKQEAGAKEKAEDGGEEGLEKVAQKYFHAFSKFAQLKELFAPARCLCKHEVALHEMRATSFGNWYPVAFPECTMPLKSPKFHILVDEHVKIIKQHWTCGMYTCLCSQMGVLSL